MSLSQIDDDWTPAKLVQHRAWRAKMYRRHEPKPDALAAKLEVLADGKTVALETRVRELEESLQKAKEVMAATLRRWHEREEEVFKATPKVAFIMRVVAKFYGVTVTDLRSSRRTMPLVRQRQVGMYICKQLTLRSMPEIGRHFGGKDHTTVLHAIRKISSVMLADPVLCQEVVAIEQIIEGTP